MGCLHGKEQENIIELEPPRTQLYERSSVERDPSWDMIRSAYLSLAYMRQLDERIRVVEMRNRTNEDMNIKQKVKNQEQAEKNRQEFRCLELIVKYLRDINKTQEQRFRQQEARYRKQKIRNKDQKKSNRNQEKLNLAQEYRNKLQEEKNKCQEEKYEEQEHQNMKQNEMNKESNKTNEYKGQVSLKQEKNNEVKKQYSSDRIHRAVRIEIILEENDDLEDIIRNLHKDLKNHIDSLAFMQTHLKIDKATQTETEPLQKFKGYLKFGSMLNYD